MATDWTKRFRPASFRGVGFKVEVEAEGGARRLSVSPIAYSETSVIEDMGRDPGWSHLTAYVAGEASDAAALRLKAALDAPGPGLLVMPMGGGRRVRVTGWDLSRHKSRGGFVAFDVTFIEEGLGSVPFGALAGAGALGSLLAAGAAIIGLALARSLREADPVQVEIERAAAASASTRFSAMTTRISAGGEMPKAIAAADVALATAAPGVAEAPEAFVAALVDGWRQAAAIGDAEALAGFVETELLSGFTGSSGQARGGTAESAVLAGALAVTAVRRNYPARQDATRARDHLASSVAPAIAHAAGLDADVVEWLTGLTGEAAETVSRIAATRAPLVRVETQISLSAIVAAYRLYGDAGRAGDLVARNRVATAAFMPLVFEAESG